MSLYFRKPQLKNEDTVLNKYIKKKNTKYLINLEDSFNLKKENILKIIRLISSLNNNIKTIKILVVSNLSYQIFDKIFFEKLLLKKIKSKIEYVDYASFLNKKENNNNQYNFIFVLPDSSDLQDISKEEDIYFKIYYEEIKIFIVY